MDPAYLSAAILLLSLALFVSDRLRHDLVAVIALLLCVLGGIVAPRAALAGFSDPAVITVAAVLVIGRAVELSGVANALTARISRMDANYPTQLFTVLLVGAALSAFMNNIAALVITMPIVSKLAQDARRSPTTALMPLAFATILGGMTTLIGTPPNLILSSVRREHLGEGFSFFAMSGVGVCVTFAGLVFLAIVGFRLLPERRAAMRGAANPWRVFELIIPGGVHDRRSLTGTLRTHGARILSFGEDRVNFWHAERAGGGRRVLVLSRKNPWNLAEETGFEAVHQRSISPDAVTVRCVVAHGSYLIGRNYDMVAARTEGQLAIVAAGPRAARAKRALEDMQIQAGDQLFVHGSALAIAEFVSSARLLEIGRHDTQTIDKRRAASILGIFASAILATVFLDVPPAIAFFAAAAAMPALRLLPAQEVYRAVDWPVIVLLAAMIPVGLSFETTGAASYVANWLDSSLVSLPDWFALFALGGVTLLLSAILNNVATAVIMGPLAIQVAELRGFSLDAALLMIVVGASAAFLTPIGHQNNLLVMRPGGYLFSDFARLGAPLAVVILTVATVYLSLFHL